MYVHVLYLLPLHSSNWLPIEWRIRLKLATMTFKALRTGRPPYLTDQLQYYQPTRSLCSSGSHHLVKPRHNLSFGSCAFRISAPRIHCLPIFVKHSHFLLSDVISKRTTFSQPFPPPSDPPANAP